MKVYRSQKYAAFEEVQVGELFDQDCAVWLKIDPDLFGFPCNAIRVDGVKAVWFGAGIKVIRYPNALLVLDGDTET